MQISVNGQVRNVPDATTLAELIEQLDLKADRMAAERNLRVVPKAEYANTVLTEGDHIEIVSFVGGG